MKDNTLLFEVKGQYIVRLDSIEPVAKCRNLYKAQFQFKTDEWTGTKTALFVQGECSKSVILDENGVCEIPWEFFDADSTTFGYVSVYCGDLVTANRVVVDIVKSGYQESDASVPPSPDVYQQLVELAEDTKEIAQSVREDADAGEFDGEEGYSPKVSLTEELDGVTVTVQNKDVLQSAKVKNGKDGKPGKDGDPGTDGITPHIGENGNWYIGDTDTGKPSRGPQGENATDKQVRTAVDAYMEENPVAITVDPTLAQEGQAADAKATGDKILQYAIKATASGESIVLTDSTEEKLQDIKLFGKSEQLTTTGKNLFDIDEFLKLPLEQFSNYGNARVLIITLKPNTACTMHTDNTGSLTGEVDVSRSLYFTSVDDMMLDGNTTGVFKGHNITKTSDETGKLKIVLIDRKNAIPIVNKEKYVMLAEGSTALPYEPYTGGKPSPSVEYPQEIVSAGKYDETSGKYLFDVEVTGNLFNHTKAKSGWIATSDGKQSLVALGGSDNVVSDYIPVHSGMIYTSSAGVYKYFYDSEKNFLKYETPSSSIIIPNNVKYMIVIVPVNRAIVIQTAKKLIIYESDTGLKTLKFSLDRPLTKWDKIEKRDGVYGIVYKHRTVDDFATLVKGSEPIYGNTGEKYFSVVLKDATLNYNYDKVYSEVGLYKKDVQKLYVPRVMASSFIVGVNDTDTIETAKEHMHYKVIYETDSKEFVSFDEETQIALNALHTNYPTTVITNSEDCEMEVTYVCDTKTYIDNKFKELQQATISTNLEMLERRYEVIL